MELGFVKSPILVDNELLLMQELPTELGKVKGTIPLEARDQFHGAINLCTPDIIGKFRADLRLYMEACCYASSCKSGPSVFLITEDYKL